VLSDKTRHYHLDGKEASIKSPQHLQTLGISTVYQEVNLCTNLTVAENILLGREPRKFGSIDWKAMNDRADQLLRRLNIHIDVTRPMEAYSVAIQQMAAIVRALEISSAKILILDEPTSSLDATETAKLFQVMRKLKDEDGYYLHYSFPDHVRSCGQNNGSQKRKSD
jgi:simple sugar transport system ATP-binding protein